MLGLLLSLHINYNVIDGSVLLFSALGICESFISTLGFCDSCTEGTTVKAALGSPDSISAGPWLGICESGRLGAIEGV